MKLLNLFSLIFVILFNVQSHACLPADINKFFQNQDCIDCDLTEICFGCVSDNHARNRHDTTYQHTQFTRTDFNEYEITRVHFKNSNLVLGGFFSTTIAESELEASNLSYFTISVSFFINTEFFSDQFHHASVKKSVFSHCRFKQVNFKDAIFTSVMFVKSTFSHVNFENASLKHADFNGSQFDAVNFTNADLSYACFLGSNISEDQLKVSKTYRCAVLADGTVFDNHGQYNCQVDSEAKSDRRTEND